MHVLPTSPAARTAVVHAALQAAHEIGDYLVQRDTDATTKGHPGHQGRAACARHCLTYTATQALALYAANQLLHLRLRPGRAVAGLALSGLTHYAIDRCAGHWADTGPDTPALVRAVHATGKRTWLQRDPGAPALLDQALHKGCIALAAVLAAGHP
ncbi:DUF3307 domain-containing protein [Streptomyces sp. KAU_LT]|uniref:DUF3307 domain-containing protein n=1 Tax=Streptomyces sp. KAU_LT TaxID=3046669 RepID=UPI0024B73902|nr:DUF3307 domain-containing protein [Streptomyces sp. KAU_LT]MDI9836237.1 DUF3307 domain-containing protein [Streptomyces sp. KAU_LT]